MLASYKRYWEPSKTEVMFLSLPIGAITTLLTQPLEFVKTRVQLRTEGIGIRNNFYDIGVNPWKVFRKIHETGGGLRQFYYGVDAALYSRLSYLLVRNFLYKTIYDKVKPPKKTNDLTLREKGVLSAFVGGIAGFISTPFELVQTRMIADGAVPSHMRRNYTSALDGLAKIVEVDGYKGLFRGGFANVVRLAAVNASLTGPYDYLNEKLHITFGAFGFNEFLSLVWASGWATALTIPLDNIKTRLMRQYPDPAFNRIHYLSYYGALIDIVEIEGVTTLWSGSYPYFGKMLIVGFLTTYLANLYMDNQKKKAGLQGWQI